MPEQERWKNDEDIEYEEDNNKIIPFPFGLQVHTFIITFPSFMGLLSHNKKRETPRDSRDVSTIICMKKIRLKL